jgi:hypothetical protein
MQCIYSASFLSSIDALAEKDAEIKMTMQIAKAAHAQNPVSPDALLRIKMAIQKSMDTSVIF